MAKPVLMFQNHLLTTANTPVTTQARAITFTQDWLGLLVRVDDAAGTGAELKWGVQWSHTGEAPWFDASTLGTAKQPGTYISSLPVQGAYWRLRAIVTGEGGAFTCTAVSMV